MSTWGPTMPRTDAATMMAFDAITQDDFDQLKRCLENPSFDPEATFEPPTGCDVFHLLGWAIEVNSYKAVKMVAQAFPDLLGTPCTIDGGPMGPEEQAKRRSQSQAALEDMQTQQSSPSNKRARGDDDDGNLNDENERTAPPQITVSKRAPLKLAKSARTTTVDENQSLVEYVTSFGVDVSSPNVQEWVSWVTEHVLPTGVTTIKQLRILEAEDFESDIIRALPNVPLLKTAFRKLRK